jgi:hypothetical protein
MYETRQIINGCMLALPAPVSRRIPGITLCFNFHSSSQDHFEHYYNLTITQYDSRGRTVSNKMYNWNIVLASGALPAGWGEDMGLQFQVDIANAGTSMTEYVDRVTLTAW